jgi:hypothetical protein
MSGAAQAGAEDRFIDRVEPAVDLTGALVDDEDGGGCGGRQHVVDLPDVVEQPVVNRSPVRAQLETWQRRRVELHTDRYLVRSAVPITVTALPPCVRGFRRAVTRLSTTRIVSAIIVTASETIANTIAKR